MKLLGLILGLIFVGIGVLLVATGIYIVPTPFLIVGAGLIYYATRNSVHTKIDPNLIIDEDGEAQEANSIPLENAPQAPQPSCSLRYVDLPFGNSVTDVKYVSLGKSAA